MHTTAPAARIDAAIHKGIFRQRVELASRHLEYIMDKLSSDKPLDFDQAKQIVTPLLFGDSQKCMPIVDLMEMLRGPHDYTYHHGVAVAALAAFIGRWLELPEDQVFELTISGYLHDIGKAKVSVDILDKPGALSPDEWESVHAHPTYACEWLMETPGVSQSVICAIREHHERNDGSGYPNQLQDSGISLFAKILAVCDGFHAIISKRVYKDPLSPFGAVKELEEQCPTKYDPRAVKALLHGMLENYRGCKVRLSDGTEGTIIYIDAAQPLRPIISTEGGPKDLTEWPHLLIEEVLG